MVCMMPVLRLLSTVLTKSVPTDSQTIHVIASLPAPGSKIRSQKVDWFGELRFSRRYGSVIIARYGTHHEGPVFAS